MIKNLFNRAEFSRFSGIHPNMAYRLEKRGLLVPIQKQYTYNQIVFGRVLDQAKKALGTPKIAFAEGFGPRAQHEICWDTAELIYLSQQGAAIVPYDQSVDISPVINEWCIPLEKEVFVMSSNDKDVREFLREFFNIVPMENIPILLIILPRVRKAIESLAEKEGILYKVENSKEFTLVG